MIDTCWWLCISCADRFEDDLASCLVVQQEKEGNRHFASWSAGLLSISSSFPLGFNKSLSVINWSAHSCQLRLPRSSYITRLLPPLPLPWIWPFSKRLSQQKSWKPGPESEHHEKLFSVLQLLDAVEWIKSEWVEGTVAKKPLVGEIVIYGELLQCFTWEAGDKWTFIENPGDEENMWPIILLFGGIGLDWKTKGSVTSSLSMESCWVSGNLGYFSSK